MPDFEDIYETMTGLRAPGWEVPGVENAFAPGGLCDTAYEDALAAYARLCARLGCGEEDPDMEIILNSMLTIQRELCRRMFACFAAG